MMRNRVADGKRLSGHPQTDEGGQKERRELVCGATSHEFVFRSSYSCSANSAAILRHAVKGTNPFQPAMYYLGTHSRGTALGYQVITAPKTTDAQRNNRQVMGQTLDFIGGPPMWAASYDLAALR